MAVTEAQKYISQNENHLTVCQMSFDIWQFPVRTVTSMQWPLSSIPGSLSFLK